MEADYLGEAHMAWTRRAATIVAAVAFGVMLSGAAKAAPVEITFRFNDPEQKEMRAALDAFEAANPGIKVNLERMAWKDARDQFLREAAVGEGPDVVHIAFVWAKEMGEAGALLPLDSLVKSPVSPVKLDDFVAMDLATGKDGKLYALPWTMDTWAMVYRSDILKQAGVSTVPGTWDDVRAASRAVHATTGKAGFGFPAGSAASGSLWFLANYVWWSNGKSLVERDGSSFHMGVTAKDIASAMAYYKSYLDDGDTPKSMLGVSDWGDPAIVRGLVDGNIAIGIMPPASFKGVTDAYAAAHPGDALPFVSGPVPRSSVVGTSHLGGRMLGINADTKHQAEAWKLVQFLNDKALFTGAYKTQFPAQKSLLQTIEFAPEVKGFAEQMQHTRTWGAYTEGPAPMGTMWNLTGRSFGAALSGQQPVDVAAADLAAQLKKLIEAAR
jgi:multiple sugar transport system substrate-binding protein